MSAALLVLLAQLADAPASAPWTRLRDALDPADRTEIVLDLSGSMALPVATIPPRSRLEYVQAELGQHLGALPGRTHVGLRVFGTQGCGPSTVLTPPAPLDGGGREALLATVGTLRPAGATPLARALREAGRSLGDAPGTILLLSDGGDSCEGMAAVCAAAREIASRSGGRVRVDLVQLFLGPAERTALACVPQATGGRWIDLTQAVDGGLRRQLLGLVPLRVGVALLVILTGLLALVGATDLLASALARRLRPGLASVLAELVLVSGATAWILGWTRPLLALPPLAQGLLVLLGVSLLAVRIGRFVQARRPFPRGSRRRSVPVEFLDETWP